MGMRSQPITPFQSGQTSTGPREKAERVPVHFRMSKIKNAGQPDALRQALTAPPRVFSDTEHMMKRPVGSSGHVYQPHWASVHRDSRFSSRATSYPSHRSAMGENAVGRAPNRRGGNAVGNPPNRYGESALAARFIPRGGGHKP